jgi:hypothetical protein
VICSEHLKAVPSQVPGIKSGYLPWIVEQKRPSTVKGYRDIWELHLRPLCSKIWMKQVRTHHVQGWLSELGRRKLSRNTLKNMKSVISAIFRLAKQQDYFRGENPAHDTAISPAAPEPSETHAYSLDEVHAILTKLPEPAARLRSPSRPTRGCGTARSRACGGKIIETVSFMFRVPSGTGGSANPKRGGGGHQSRSFRTWQIVWICIELRREILRMVRSSEMLSEGRSHYRALSIAWFCRR